MRPLTIEEITAENVPPECGGSWSKEDAMLPDDERRALMHMRFIKPFAADLSGELQSSLLRRGLIEEMNDGSRRFQITDAGRAALAECAKQHSSKGGE